MVTIPAERASAVGLLATGAYGRGLAVGFPAEVIPEAVGLPLDHPRREGLVDVLALFVEA